jgi:hypothetical protein
MSELPCERFKSTLCPPLPATLALASRASARWVAGREGVVAAPGPDIEGDRDLLVYG